MHRAPGRARAFAWRPSKCLPTPPALRSPGGAPRAPMRIASKTLAPYGMRWRERPDLFTAMTAVEQPGSSCLSSIKQTTSSSFTCAHIVDNPTGDSDPIQSRDLSTASMLEFEVQLPASPFQTTAETRETPTPLWGAQTPTETTGRISLRTGSTSTARAGRQISQQSRSEMGSPRLPRILISTLTFLGLISSACLPGPGGDQACQVDDRGFWRKETIEQCRAVEIVDTGFVSLDDIFKVSSNQNFTLRRNTELQNIDGLSGAEGVSIQAGNSSLSRVNITLGDVFSIDDSHLEEMNLQFQGSSPRFILGRNATLTAANVECESDCELELTLVSLTPTQLRLDPHVRLSMLITSKILDHSTLEGFGVPRLVRVYGEQDEEPLDLYLEWLRSQGFSGEFLVCPQTLDDCSPRQPEDPQAEGAP